MGWKAVPANPGYDLFMRVNIKVAKLIISNLKTEEEDWFEHSFAVEKKLSFPFSQITTELLFKVQLRAERRQVLVKG